MIKINRKRIGVFRALLILLIVVLTATGCQNAKLKKGFDNQLPLIRIGVKSETNTFSIDNVTFDLYYGFYDVNESIDDEKRRYGELVYQKMFFAIYIHDSYAKVHRAYNADYKSIEEYYFVKEISEEEAFSKEYGYIDGGRWKGTEYNHKEMFTIPKEFFKENAGRVEIEVLCFYQISDTEKPFVTSKNRHMKLSYKKLNENTVEIK